MNAQGVLFELLMAGFFAVACFRARAELPVPTATHPWQWLFLTSRYERMRRSRWQWASMLLLLLVVRREAGLPLLAELLLPLQLLLFVALPTAKPAPETAR